MKSIHILSYDTNEILCSNTVKDGYHDQGLFRHLQDYAPGVKNSKK